MAFGFSKVANAYTPWTPTQGQSFTYHDPKQRKQIVGEAEGGHIKVMDIGRTVQFFRLTWEGMKKEDRDNLVGFIQDATVNYRELTFTYEDHNAATHTVRIWETSGINTPVVANDLYQVEILLRKEI